MMLLVLSLTLSVLAMILLPILFAALVRRRFQVPWILFAIGTATFIGSQVVHLPLNQLLVDLHILPKSGVSDPSISLLQSSLVLGLTAGVCEETARAVGYLLLRHRRSFADGLMLALGHGGVESMIFGGVLTAAAFSSLIPLIGKDVSALNLSPDQASALEVQLRTLAGAPVLSAFYPLLERLLAMGIHIVLSLLVLQAFRRRNVLYYLAAVSYHLVVDALAVWASVTLKSPAQIYLGLAGLLLPGLAWVFLTYRKEFGRVQAYTQTIGAELGIFMVALRKEILQQWRTRRFLVVMAVFVLFGLTSPLLAKFTPEIIKSIAGAEQYASLIPTPTVKDAIAQYMKNLTQFGFLLAVLLGMTAVAGEKESGTAAMILSKPLSRWAFVLSKFFAQVLVYGSAFLVAGLGAYDYTVILFGAFDPLKFLGINLLLFLWLLTFVGAALLGSVIGPSIAAAAGVGLAISVAFLLAGSIPVYGALAPDGLIAWASALGSGADKVVANGGALAVAAVLIVLCLVWAVALFERQEI